MEQQLMSNKALMIKIILQFLFACLRFGGGFKHMTNYDSSIFFLFDFLFCRFVCYENYNFNLRKRNQMQLWKRRTV